MKPFIPHKLPLDSLDYKELIPLVADANSEISRYDGLLQGIVNPEILLSPLTNEEAVLSSKIEGTQATVDEVLEHEAGLLKEGQKSKDIQEILNYRKALFASNKHLENYPISLSFICEIHKILLSSVRGEKKNPGNFRKDQNWIGLNNCSIEQASFVPPDPLILQTELDNWSTYLKSDDIDIIIQTAVMHAQFEILHPFEDGNGRIGRILIPLFLYQKKKLSSPVFYLSSYLEANREEYYFHLNNISKSNDWDSWIKFFLKAVTIQSKQNSEKVKKIMNLYDELKNKMPSITKSHYSMQIIDAIFDVPIFDLSHLIGKVGMVRKTANSLIAKLKDENILTEVRKASGNKSAVLAFRDLLNIAEGKDVL